MIYLFDNYILVFFIPKHMSEVNDIAYSITICVVCVGHGHFEDKHKTWLSQVLGLVTLWIHFWIGQLSLLLVACIE